MTKEKQLGELQLTERGFELIEFRDQYGEACSIQQSSAMGDDGEAPGTAYLWLGCENNCFHDVTKEALSPSPRMHLNRDQVFELMILLLKWLHHGSFK